jgi:hypothetical protein
MIEQPDGIILTVGRKMYQARGPRQWLYNFKCAMDLHEQGWAYWFRVGSKPTQDKNLSYVYLCMGNKIRFRGYYGGFQETPEGSKTFETGGTIHGRFWVLISGPLEIAPRPMIHKQGFQGFRYTEKLF